MNRLPEILRFVDKERKNAENCMIWLRGPCSKAGEWDSRTVVKPCMWFQEEPSQFSMGQTAKSLTCSIMEKPHSGLDLEVKPAKVWANFYSVLAVTH